MPLTTEQLDILKGAQERAAKEQAMGQAKTEAASPNPVEAPAQEKPVMQAGMGIPAAWEDLKGAVETGMHVGSSMAGGLVGGVLAAPVAGLHPDKAASIFNQTAAAMTYQPRTESGKRDVAKIQYVMGKIDNLATWLGDPTEDGSPLVATGIKTAVLGIPTILGFKEGVPLRLQADKIAKSIVTKAAEEYGINLGDADVGPQIVKAADDRVANERGAQMSQVQKAAQEAKAADKSVLDKEFERVRGLQATLRAPVLKELADSTQEQIKSYIPEEAPVALNRMAKLREMANRQVPDPEQGGFKFQPQTNMENPLGGEGLYGPTPKTPAEVSLTELYDFNKSLSPRRFGGNVADKGALSIMRGQFRTFMEKKFNQDMIIGDPDTVAAWKNVNAKYQEYGMKFKDNKVIRQLIESDTSPEQLRAWIFNTADAGFKTTSADVIGKLNTILGKDSPPMQALRKEFVYDTVQPLLGDTPNFKKFISNYDKVMKKNSSLVDALDPFARTGMDDLYKYAKAYQNVGPLPKLTLDVDKIIMRHLLGSGLAKAAVRVSLGTTLLKMVRKTASGAQKKAMISDLIGADFKKPFISKTSLGAQAFAASEISQTLGNDSDDAGQ